MMIVILITIVVFLVILFNLIKSTKLNRNKKFFKVKKFVTFNKNNLNNWMNLTKKERYNLSKQESVSYLDKRKLLLEEIRKEYKNICKGNSEVNVKKKK